MRTEPFLAWPSHRAQGMERDMPVPGDGGDADPRRMSPRQFAEWAHDLYIGGLMDWPDYRVAGFPSELHPGFDLTIGALTGEKAEPDRPRDMLLEWERRHAFERRHHGRDSVAAERCGRILGLLRWHAESRISPPPAPPARRG